MNIHHHVSPVRQPNLNDCWATCCAMLFGLHGLNGVTEIKRRAAGVSLNSNGSLPEASISNLATVLHLEFKNLKRPPVAFTANLLQNVLRRSPAAAFGEWNYPGAPNAEMHVLLFYTTTGRDDNPMVYFIDPYTGRRYNYYLSEINENLGSVDYFLYRS